MGTFLIMAAKSRNLSLFRSLIKELRLSNGQSHKGNNLAEEYVANQFRRYQVASKKICREQNEVEHMARSYLCYLESKRKHEELQSRYSGAERSVEESARLVGLKLPETRTDS